MQPGCKVLSHRQTIGMGELLGLGQRLLTPPHGLRRIAETPQRVAPPCTGTLPQAPCQSGAPRPGVLPGREGDPLLEVPPGGGIVTQVEQECPSASWASRRSVGSVVSLGQPHELFPQLPRRLVTRPG